MLRTIVRAMAESVESKTVLLAYLESKKKIIIPGDSSKPDLDYLREEFLTSFRPKCDANVSLEVTFQRFDPEWNEFVDLDDGDVLVHKDKLKAIATPILSQQTTTPSEVSSEVTNNFFLLFLISHSFSYCLNCLSSYTRIFLHLEWYF